MKKEIYELIKELKLSPAQANICYHLIGGTMFVKDFVLKTGLARSTIVEALIDLEKQNIVRSTYLNRQKSYSLTNSSVFLNLIDSRIADLEDLQQKLFDSKEKIAKFISISRSTHAGFDNQMQLFLGKKEIAELYRSTVVEPEIFSICRLDEYYRLFPGGLMLQSKANRLKKIRNFKDLIINGSSTTSLERNKTKLDYTNYKSKVIQDSPVLRASGFTDIMICTNYVIFSNFKSSIPYSYKLNSPEIANFLKYFHIVLWENIHYHSQVDG